MDDVALLKLIDGAFEFFRERRVNEFVDVDRVLPALDVALTTPRVGRLIERLVAPARSPQLGAPDRAAGGE